MHKLRYYIIILTLIAPTSFAATAANTWEYLSKTYHIMNNNDKYLTENLNKQGKLGWELVNCTATDDSVICIFKKPKKTMNIVTLLISTIGLLARLVYTSVVYAWNFLASIINIIDDGTSHDREPAGKPGAYYNYHTDEIDPIKQSNGLYDKHP